MERLETNKNVGDTFARYLSEKFGWQYKAINCTEKRIPDVDIILISENQKRLSLQLKRPIDRDKGFMKDGYGEKVLMFNEGLFEKQIVKSEGKYKNQGADINNLILILHGYYLPDDISYTIGNGKFSISSFKGIYIVSLEYDSWKKEKVHHSEFVVEIKDAFNI